MTFRIIPTFLALASLVAAIPQASAQFPAQWNFNNTTSSTIYRTPSSGYSAASGFMGTYPANSSPAVPFAATATNGTGADPGTDIGGTVFNRGLTINPPLTSAANLSTGARFAVPTTDTDPGVPVGINFSMTVGFRSSRYWQLLASTDGTNFSVVPTGTGSSFIGTVNGLDGSQSPISGTATVAIDNAGLISFETINQNFINAPNPGSDVQGWVNNLSYTFPLGQGFENNPNFAVAIVGAYDPSYGGTDGAVGYLSSFAGTNTSDATSGYNRSLSSGGSMRMDLVTVTGVPEPTFGLAGSGLAVAALTALRRRARRS